jgi:hypothetical protein
MARTGSPGSRKEAGDDKVCKWVIGFMREPEQGTAITRVLSEGELPVFSAPSMRPVDFPRSSDEVIEPRGRIPSYRRALWSNWSATRARDGSTFRKL